MNSSHLTMRGAEAVRNKNNIQCFSNPQRVTSLQLWAKMSKQINVCIRGQILEQRAVDLPLPPTSSSSSWELWGIPKPRNVISSACPGSAGVLAPVKHAQNSSRGGVHEASSPDSQTSSWRSRDSTESPPDDQASHPISKGESTHPTLDIHLSCLHLWSHSLGCNCRDLPLLQWNWFCNCIIVRKRHVKQFLP